MKRFWFIVLLSACSSDERGLRDSSVDTAPDVRSDVTPPEPLRNAPRYVEPRRSVLTNDQVGRLAIPFQENDGQWPDDVAFKADHFAGSLWVTNDGSIVYSLLGPQVDEAEPEPLGLGSSLTAPNSVTDPFGLHRAPSSLVEVIDPSSTPINIAIEQDVHDPFERNHEPPNRGPGWTLVEHFVHGHPHRPRGLDPAVTNVSYFIGNDESKWAPHVSTFGELTLGEVWPGIEVRLVARGNNVEKFFHVRPHRDPSLIEMSVEGSEPLRLSGDGALIATTGNGEVELSPPVAFQVINGERREVEVRYELASDDSYRFVLGDYDRSHEVVVDPVLQSTYLGGTGLEHSGGVTIDSGGNVLVFGHTFSTNYPGTAGGAQPARSGNQDLVISRLNSTLTAVLQSTYLGGTNFEFGLGGITIDSGGNVLVFGHTLSVNYPGTAGGAQPSLSGPDLVISRLNSTLTALLQSTYLGGSATEDGYGDIRLDAAGNVLVLGRSNSTNYPGTTGGAQASSGGDYDMVTSRLNGTLTALVQSTYLGGSGFEDGAGSITLDSGGNVLVLGHSGSANYPGTAGGARATNAGGYDLVISRLNGTLTALLQSTYLGGGSNEYGNGGIVLDSGGNVLALGRAQSGNYTGTTGGAQPNNAGSTDMVISRLNATLTTLLQSTYLGGTAFDDSGSIILDTGGNVLVVGNSSSTNYAGVSGGAQASSSGQVELVLSRLNGTLTTLLQSTYLGGSSDDNGSNDLVLDSSGDLLVIGQSDSSNFPGVTGGAQSANGGAPDLVLSRIASHLQGCTSNADCLTNPGGGLIFSGRPYCNLGTRQCVACVNNADCEDGNLCTTNTCNTGVCSTTNLSAGTSCRASAGTCDIAETCPGAGAPCPADGRRPNGFSCRASAGVCDLAEVCDGLNAACPFDAFTSNAVECRASGGVCDIAETCTGSSATCPSDNKRPNGFSCRASAGVCDVAEVCNGSLNTCPAEAFASSAVQCRASGGVCDVAENCTGSAALCPSDVLRPNGFSCRASAGVCDVAEVCNGSIVTCPVDAFASNAVQCRSASGSCDVAEFCSGSVASCPSDVYQSSGAGCAGGVCDGANMCVECVTAAHCEDGNACTTNTCVSNVCQSSNVSAGTSCGGGLTCNGSGSCSGCSMPSQCSDGNPCTSDVCSVGACSNPPLAEGAACAGGVCRNGSPPLCVECLTNAQCGGSTPFCSPTNVCVECLGDAECDDSRACNVDQCVAGVCQHPFVAAGNVCRSASGVCDAAEVCSGASADCPIDAFMSNATECRGAAGVCDAAERCTGSSAVCPADVKLPDGFECRAAGGVCDVAEVCDGSANTCPADGFRSSSFECRAVLGECDTAEFCPGGSANCPADGFDSSGTNCSGGVCDGSSLCVECVQNADCEDGNPCTVNTCSGNTCSVMNATAGTACGSGLSCNALGVCSGCAQDIQCADGNDCTADVCSSEGECTNPPVSEATTCSTGVCEVSGTPSCVQCVSDAQCNGTTPHCNVNTNTCVACLLASDCNDDNDCTNDVCTLGACSKPLLAEGTMCGVGGLCSASGLCQECLSDSDCTGSSPLCDLTSRTCVPCTDPDVTCPTGVCVTMGVNQGQCAQCNSSSDCSRPTPLCLPSANTCVYCADPRVACPSGTLCDPTTGECAPTGGCDDDTECASPIPTCNTATRMCIGCGDGSVMCPSTELCDPQTGRCGLDPNGDADDDGINNGIECAALLNCPDTDGDTIADYLDPDDDGDSIPTSVECPNPSMCLNTDGDDLPNYLDPDDDGDGISTADEVSDGLIHGGDVDLDGVPNYLSTDSDRDGSSDRIEGRNNSPNGVPAYLDVNFLGGGGIAGGALRCSVDTRNDHVQMVLFLLSTMGLAFVRRRHRM